MKPFKASNQNRMRNSASREIARGFFDDDIKRQALRENEYRRTSPDKEFLKSSQENDRNAHKASKVPLLIITPPPSPDSDRTEEKVPVTPIKKYRKKNKRKNSERDVSCQTELSIQTVDEVKHERECSICEESPTESSRAMQESPTNEAVRDDTSFLESANDMWSPEESELKNVGTSTDVLTPTNEAYRDETSFLKSANDTWSPEERELKNVGTTMDALAPGNDVVVGERSFSKATDDTPPEESGVENVEGTLDALASTEDVASGETSYLRNETAPETPDYRSVKDYIRLYNELDSKVRASSRAAHPKFRK